MIKEPVRAYLDIETTGLTPDCSYMTVVGVYLVSSKGSDFRQFVGQGWASQDLLEYVCQADILYTYNGSRFDLPFIQAQTGLVLHKHVKHVDLMYNCWKCNLRGGLKKVEKMLGIERALPDVNGYMAVILWQRYQAYGDEYSLEKLLAYNKEDCVNLHTLRQKLEVD